MNYFHHLKQKTGEWIGFNFDGVLVKRDANNPDNFGDNIQEMMDLLHYIDTETSYTVKILTPRAENDSDLLQIKKWLKDNGLNQSITITNKIDSDLLIYFSSNVARVLTNKGKFCKDCKNYANILLDNLLEDKKFSKNQRNGIIY